MHPDARCLDCGYLLRGLTEARCPECGRVFSPDDPFTVSAGGLYGRLLRWALRPTRGPAPIAYWVAWGLVGIAGTLLVGPRWPTIIYSGIWIVFLLPYAIHGTCRNLVVRIYKRPRSLRQADRRGVRKILSAFSVPFFLMALGMPLHIPFYLSLPWINSLALRAWNGPVAGPYPPPQWAGCYRVTILDVTPRSVRAKIGWVVLLFYSDDWRRLPGWRMDYIDVKPIGGGWYRAWDPEDDGPFNLGW